MNANLFHAGAGMHGLRAGRYSLLWSAPRAARLGLLALLLAVCIALALMAGSTWIAPSQLWDVLLGQATAGTALLVLEFRLPRVLAGVLAGASLGIAGALLQAITRNRLATPDLLGMGDGAALGLFVAMTSGAAGMSGLWWAGPAGAFGAVALLLAACGGLGRQGTRLLVVGLGLSGLLRALTELVLSRQELAHASALYTWSIGSLNGRDYDTVLPLAAGLALMTPLTWLMARRLALLRFDPDTAASLGMAPRATAWQALLIASALAGLAVGMCGPLAFVALAAPYAAGRVIGAAPMATGGAGLSGAMLVVAADTAGRILLREAELPAGVICQLLGGPFLLWLLLSGRRGESP